MESIWIVHTDNGLALEENIIAICDDEELAVETMHLAIEEEGYNPDRVWVDHFYLMLKGV